LQQLVKIYHLKEAGSAFPPEVWNLDALPPEDSAGELLTCNPACGKRIMNVVDKKAELKLPGLPVLYSVV
jgi:hypothetical protein